MKKSQLRSRWVNMLSRCEDEDATQYKDYGGRGVYVCDEWHDYEKFYDWCISQNISKELQIDRIDNTGPYSPDNCRLVTRRDNARNKSTNRLLTVFGETKCMMEWSEDDRCVVSYQSLSRRLSIGWNPEQAITVPSGHRRPGRVANNIKYYEGFGETKTLNEWTSDPRLLVGHGTFRSRVRDGWSIEEALTKPTQWNKGLVHEGRTIFQWSQDEDCEVSYNTLARRLKAGKTVAEAKKK